MMTTLTDRKFGAEGCCAALGSFDGVHLGHQAVIREAVLRAEALDCAPVVWTFSSLPFGKATTLTDAAQRQAIFAGLGAARLYLEDFDSLRGLSPEEFVERVLIGALDCRCAVCGFNYRFGRDGAGDFALLERLMSAAGREALCMPAVEYAGAPVSSTRIREAVQEGRMEEARAMLGRPYSLWGTVCHGRTLGRTLGFPTANLLFAEGRTVPRRGVYASAVTLEDGRRLRGVTNVGVRPTLRDGQVSPVCETCLLDFAGDLYGRPLRVDFLRFMRDEKRFGSLEELQKTVDADRESVRRADLSEFF